MRRLFPESPRAYWESRAREHGARSVLNLGHPVGSVEAVTATQKAEILPHLVAALRGGEHQVLDFGCGPGRFTPELATLTRASVLGVDIVARYFELAPRAPGVHYARIAEGMLPVADASIDVVFACLVLGGMRGRVLQRSVAELDRVLKPGGLLFLVENTTSVPDAPHWSYRSVAAHARLFPGVALAHLHDYEDLGERISLMAGRKTPARS